ncbi:hypothetical protein DRQ36_01295 [bacterium]|nr:MAG: hypothetical protein DRQ36_01295 [bacterium]
MPEGTGVGSFRYFRISVSAFSPRVFLPIDSPKATAFPSISDVSSAFLVRYIERNIPGPPWGSVFSCFDFACASGIPLRTREGFETVVDRLRRFYTPPCGTGFLSPFSMPPVGSSHERPLAWVP